MQQIEATFNSANLCGLGFKSKENIIKLDDSSLISIFPKNKTQEEFIMSNECYNDDEVESNECYNDDKVEPNENVVPNTNL